MPHISLPTGTESFRDNHLKTRCMLSIVLCTAPTIGKIYSGIDLLSLRVGILSNESI